MPGHYRGRVSGPGVDVDVCQHCHEIIYFDPSHFDGSWLHQDTQFRLCHMRSGNPFLIAAPVGAGTAAPITEEPLRSPRTPGTIVAELERDAAQLRYEKNLSITLAALYMRGIVLEDEDFTRLKAFLRTMPNLIEDVQIEDHRRRPRWGIPRVPWWIITALVAGSFFYGIGHFLFGLGR